MNQTLTHYSIELFANKMPCFSLNNTHLLYVPFFKKSHTKAEHVKGKNPAYLTMVEIKLLCLILVK